VRVTGRTFLSNPPPDSYSFFPDPQQPLRDFGNLYSRGHCYADARYIQPDAVRDADVPFVLYRDFCRLPVGTAPGEPEVPLEEGHDHSYPRTAPTSFSAIHGHYQVRIKIGTTLAVFNPLMGVFL